MPDVLVKGDGYQIKDVVGFDLVPEVFIAPSVEQASTTKFIDEWAKRK
jgi:bifunctional ADP-heptose synthase (sugar kinase/adenylyltransferase)